MGVLAVRQYKFRATAALDPAGDNAAGAYLSRTRGHCAIEFARRRYFPALISCDNQPPPLGGLNILVRIALTDTEADLFFAPGQRFTILVRCHRRQDNTRRGPGRLRRDLVPGVTAFAES
jgi:hypothetical protein